MANNSEDGELRKILREFFKSRAARVVGVVVLVAVVVSILFLLLNWYVAPTKPSDRKDLVLAVAQILGGAALLSGLYFTWRTLQVNREGQITERFTRAIDQLGATDDERRPKLEIRLGGIYALERIARDSPERDYSTVMKVLAAYARSNAPWSPIPWSPMATSSSTTAPDEDTKHKGTEQEKESSARASASTDATERNEEAEQTAPPSLQEDLPAHRPDIQAILDIFKRREVDRVPREHRIPLDLRGTDLRGAALRGADFSYANLQGANFSMADLQHANLRGAHLIGADLRSLYLTQVILVGADLREANFQRALLFDADLSYANCEGATFEEAYLGGSNLLGAILLGADLRGVKDLTQNQIESAIGDERTRLPDGFDRPVRWRYNTDEEPNADN